MGGKLLHASIPFGGHQAELRCRRGFVELGRSNDDVFEIPGQGLGFFACRKDVWPGFNPHARRQFGGEEMYIHEKVRWHVAAAVCL